MSGAVPRRAVRAQKLASSAASKATSASDLNSVAANSCVVGFFTSESATRPPRSVWYLEMSRAWPNSSSAASSKC